MRFILPGENTKIKDMRNSDSLTLASPLIQDLKYFELILGNKIDETEILKLF